MEGVDTMKPEAASGPAIAGQAFPLQNSRQDCLDSLTPLWLGFSSIFLGLKCPAVSASKKNTFCLGQVSSATVAKPEY